MTGTFLQEYTLCIFQLLLSPENVSFPPLRMCQLEKLSHMRNLPPQKLPPESQHLVDFCKNIEMFIVEQPCTKKSYVRFQVERHQKECLLVIGLNTDFWVHRGPGPQRSNIILGG